MPKIESTATQLIHAPYIVPIEGAQRVLTDHSVVIGNNLIIDLLPTHDAKQRYAATPALTLENQVLLPGFINAHGHSAMSLFRGVADDLPLMEWLNNHIWPAEAKWVNASFVEDGIKLAIAEMLKGGTTCFSDMYFFPEATAEAALEAGIRAQLSFPILDFPSAWGRDADDYIHKGLTQRDKWQHHELISFVFGPHAPYTVSNETFERIARESADTGLPIHIHLHETAGEVEAAQQEHGTRPIARLQQLGLLSEQLQCVHMTALNDSDIEQIQSSGAHVIHCPASNLKLASGFCPVQRLSEAGINVALGTDGAASNNGLSLFSEMRLASLLAKAVASNASAANAHASLRMATINGARALGIDAQTGSLEAGKAADIISIACDTIFQQPLYNPASQLVYTDVSPNVANAWVDGKPLLRNGQLTQIDETELLSRAENWQQRIAAKSQN